MSVLITNPNLVRYRLIDIAEEDALWLDLDNLKLINFATITDNELDVLAAKYADWADNLFELLQMDKIAVGGPYFNSATTVAIGTNAGTFTPIGEVIGSGVTIDGDPIWEATYYQDDSLVATPPAPMGILDAMVITTTDITYLGGVLPSYLQSLQMVGVGLVYIDLEAIPEKCTALNFNGNVLTETSVDTILILLDANGANGGEVLLQGPAMAAPSSTGDAAVTSLMSKGWTVRTQ